MRPPIAGARHSHLEIQNNGALDVTSSFTWLGWVNLHNISRDAPIFVWMPHVSGCKTYASGLTARVDDKRINLHFSAVSICVHYSYITRTLLVHYSYIARTLLQTIKVTTFVRY